MKKKTMKWLLFCICMLFLCGCSDLETEEKNLLAHKEQPIGEI